MASRRQRKKTAIETVIYAQAGVSGSPLDSVALQSKDTDFQSEKQNPCLKCPNWTRCVGYQQRKECISKGGHYE